jgi:hypothetical protein
MIWKAIKEINREMFQFSAGDAPTGVWKLATAIAGVAGAIGFYWKIPDSVAEWLFYRFYDSKAAKLAFESWQLNGHIGMRLLVVAAFFLLFYLVMFAAYAIKRLDYRGQVARSFGMRFRTVRREHDVLNIQGDCRTTSTESFLVDELQLSYIERRLQVPPNVTRSAAVITIEGLPPGTNAPTKVQDIGATRTYGVNFTPALHQTLEAATLKIEETIEKVIFMSQQVTPVHPTFKSKVESISLLVVEPIEILELSVTFPYGYAVGGASQICVCYGRTPTVHDQEMQRLRSDCALKPENKDGRQSLRLVVETPIMGLQYYLYWEPPA